jgi:hypothetical protein
MGTDVLFDCAMTAEDDRQRDGAPGPAIARVLQGASDEPGASRRPLYFRAWTSRS